MPHDRISVVELHDQARAKTPIDRPSSACGLALTLLCPSTTRAEAPDHRVRQVPQRDGRDPS